MSLFIGNNGNEEQRKKEKARQTYPESDYSNESSYTYGTSSDPMKQSYNMLYNSDQHQITSLSNIGDNARSQVHPSAQSIKTMVYISDLPLGIEDPVALEKEVRRLIKKTIQVEVDRVRCYPEFGFGIIHGVNNQIKDILVRKVQQILFDSENEQAKILFTDTLEVNSYIVLDVNKQNEDVALPTPEEVTNQWIEFQAGEKPLSCNRLNAQFPNIYEVVSTFSDRFISSISKKDFIIKGLSARIYYCADCSFFEDLPSSTTQEQLKEAIGSAIRERKISSSFLYTQLNKQTRNACIIATGKARKWTTETCIYLNDKPISKKNDLTCRLLLRPVPQTVDVNRIINNQIFSGKVTRHDHNDENLILELSNKKAFDECLKYGACNVDNRLLRIEVYGESTNPEGCEIDAATWYETEMIRYKPDIMQFVANPEHIIFRYRWNPKVWLDEFQRSAAQHHDRSDQRGRKPAKPDQTRHLLRMTVMLNTIAVVRKKSYLLGDREVKLNLSDKLKTIVYNHESKLEQCEKIPLDKTLYKQTDVSVVQEDCLVVYERLVKNGNRPLLLNMANATTPGGGYRKGDGAQEENIFRRSDYFRSLDMEFDEYEEQPPERFYCTSNYKVSRLADQKRIYPMDEFGAIYTSGLTVFRQPEETGYAYMKKPLSDVCAVAMAAYREPQLEGNMLSPKYAVGMRKKIENIFSIAYHNQHDSLVLSALGCGAFKNPPDHVAQLFSSVIEQYAGFFKLIVFAIIDDHNTGRHLNKQGNFKPFQTLDSIPVKPIRPMNIPYTMFGPYRLLSDGLTVSDVSIFDSMPCQNGATCNNIHNPSHARQFSHPPLCAFPCSNGKCSRSDNIVHMQSFIHRNYCQYGGECRQIDNEKHNQQFEHPSYCSEGSNCQNMAQEHLRQYRHVDLCPESYKCKDFQKRVKPHCDVFRHCAPNCPHGSHCINFHDKKHTVEYLHPFPVPCQFTPYHCQFHTELIQASKNHPPSQAAQEHCLNYGHVCPNGRNCTETNPSHSTQFIHVARSVCPNGSRCTQQKQEDHLNSFTHQNIPDIRCLCKDTNCGDRNKLPHSTQYRHSIPYEDGEIVKYQGLNANINFVQNQKDNIARINSYFKSQKWKPLPSRAIPDEIFEWLRTVQPVYRCNPVMFELILLYGHVMSQDYMKQFKKPKFVANCVLQQNQIRRIDALKENAIENDVREYVTALVTDSIQGTTVTDITKTKERNLSSSISKSDMGTLKRTAIEMAKLSIKVHSNLIDIGQGFDKTVSSILGPHLGHYYGDVFIIFKREILHHPDANFSIQTSASFDNGDAFRWRPWLGTDPGANDERIKLYHTSKLHASVPGYEYAAALEWIAITCLSLDRDPLDIDLQTILRHWPQADPQESIEANLPRLIPVSYIDHIYIPQNIFNSLSSDARQVIDFVFEDRISIMPYDVEANPPMKTRGSKPQGKSRAKYQDAVVEQLIERFKQRAKTSIIRPNRGFIITIPSSKFSEHLVLPLTISQAYTQYRIDCSKPSTDNTTYIYWQMLNGDMMVNLSNEPIDSSKTPRSSRCFICYIAEKPARDDTQYHENASYLNSGSPLQHEKFVSNCSYAASSNTFYVGCNTDDFMTFCLEIQRSTGKITLSHAGPNSIYNHTTISYTFGKTELDLPQLDFVHVSAGAKPVQIRNLMIFFEKQTDLHPTCDKEFNKDSFLSEPASSHTHAKQGHKNRNPISSAPFHDRDSQSIGSIAQGKTFFPDDYIPCPDNVNCLRQLGDDAATHNSKYSHPCRFSELCRNPEPHLTHEPHQVPMCKTGDNCNKLTDAIHRAKYRHRDMPDFLIPCRFKQACRDISDKHRIKYSHGEQTMGSIRSVAAKGKREYFSYRYLCSFYLIADNTQFQRNQQSTNQDHGHLQRIACRWGSQCRDIGDKRHCERYSHDVAAHQQGGKRTSSVKAPSWPTTGNTTRNDLLF
jgi:uncharacterized protein (TIGR02452 family)